MIKLLKLILIFLIKLYQIFISPFFPNRCNYLPTCSQYTIDSIKEYGILKGLYFGLKRIFKCHCFNKKIKFDPVKKNN